MVRTAVRKRSVALVGAAVALALALVGCSGTSGPGSVGKDGKEKATITIGLPVPASTLASVYVADTKGYFAKQGLTVKTVAFQGDGDLVKALLGGSVQIAVGSLAGVITSVDAGQDVKVFYGGFNMPAFSWFGGKGVTSIGQGKDKNWGVTTLGSSTDLLTRYVLSQKGLDPDTDVKIVQAGSSPARLAALEAGSLGASILADPVTYDAEAAGLKDILDLRSVVKDYPMHVAYASTAYMKKNPQVIKEFVTALSQGMTYTKGHPTEAGAILSKAAKFTPADSTRSINSYKDQLFPDGQMASKDGLDAFFDMSIKGGLFTSRPPESKWLDTTYLPKK